MTDWIPDNFSALIDENFRGDTKSVVVPEILKTLVDLKDYWPLTVRQVFYQLVANQVIENTRNKYSMVSRVLTRLRRKPLRIVPWKAIEDRTRRLTAKRGSESVESYLRDYSDEFFNGYDRCLVQNQKNYVEIFTEKDALSAVIEKVSWIYCVRIVVIRGQCGADYLKKYADRAREALKSGRQPVILYFGDFDPTGARIPFSIKNTLYKSHDLTPLDVIIDRIALNEDQIEKHQLPHSFDAIKQKDPNYRWFIENIGNIAVELDALHPETLQELVKHGLGVHLDTEDMLLQQGIEQKERQKMERLRQRFIEMVKEEGFNL